MTSQQSAQFFPEARGTTVVDEEREGAVDDGENIDDGAKGHVEICVTTEGRKLILKQISSDVSYKGKHGNDVHQGHDNKDLCERRLVSIGVLTSRGLILSPFYRNFQLDNGN